MSMEHQHATPFFPIAVLILGVILGIVGLAMLELNGPEMLIVGAAVFALGAITLFTPDNDRVSRK